MLSDAKDVQTLAGHRKIASTTLNIPHPYEDGMAEGWIGTHEEQFENRKGVVYAITSKDDGHLIGAISLMNIVKDHQAEMGYWIGGPYWGKGYCTEAGKALLRYGFEELGLVRVHACYLSRNPVSGKVRAHAFKWGKYEDMVLKGILKEDWITTNPRRIP